LEFPFVQRETRFMLSDLRMQGPNPKNGSFHVILEGLKADVVVAVVVAVDI